MMNVADMRMALVFTEPDHRGMREIIGAQFRADEPAVFGTPDLDYIEREIAWYMTLDRNIRSLAPPVPTIWQAVSDDEGFVNSQYGWCVFSHENGSQYEQVVKSLLRDDYSRQAVLVYTRPNIHIEAGHDFICTNTVQFFIRDQKLTTIVNMRSSDAVFGYKNDLPWHTYVRDKLLVRLRMDSADFKSLTAGDIIWNAGSFHVYPRHEHLVKEYNYGI